MIRNYTVLSFRPKGDIFNFNEIRFLSDARNDKCFCGVIDKTPLFVPNFLSNVKMTEKRRPKNGISGWMRFLFDFRGMYLALIAF